MVTRALYAVLALLYIHVYLRVSMLLLVECYKLD